jgi:anthranilate phosphoribosyltransferase
VIGVSEPRQLRTIAAALARLGAERALVVSSADGLDEFSASESTRVVELIDGRLDSYEVTPEQVGLEPAPDGAVGAGTPTENAEVLRRVLSGEPGPARSLALLNAGAAVYVGGAVDSIEAGVGRAEEAIDSGAARAVMERFVERTRALAGEVS